MNITRYQPKSNTNLKDRAMEMCREGVADSHFHRGKIVRPPPLNFWGKILGPPPKLWGKNRKTSLIFRKNPSTPL